MNTFIQQGCDKLIKSNSKDILFEKIYILNILFFLTFYLLKNPEKSITGPKKKMKQHNWFQHW